MNKTVLDERLEQVLFYTLEKAIKSYRQYAQRRLGELEHDITIDQWLILKTIHDNPGIAQNEIAIRVFKDQASITRMIEVLVQKGFLNREFHKQDRRRFSLQLSSLGKIVLADLDPVIQKNRSIALRGFGSEEVNTIKTQLEKIINNCNS